MSKRNIIFIICVCLISFLLWNSFPYVIDAYFKDKYLKQVGMLENYIANLINGDYNNVNKLTSKESKLLKRDVQNLLSVEFKKVKTESMLVSWAELTTDSNSISRCYLYVYFNRDRTSMIKAVIKNEHSDNLWKIENIFFEDHYFDDVADKGEKGTSYTPPVNKKLQNVIYHFKSAC